MKDIYRDMAKIQRIRRVSLKKNEKLIFTAAKKAMKSSDYHTMIQRLKQKDEQIKLKKN